MHETLFPEQPLDWQRDIEILAASRWPTLVNLAQFRELTGESGWPDDLAPWIRRDVLEYFCNGRVDYQVRGNHVRLEVRWDWQAEQGDDTHHALYRGTRCRLAVRQGPAEGFRPELYVLPDSDIGAALQRRIAALQARLSRDCRRGSGVGMADRDTRCAADRARRRFRSLHPPLFSRYRQFGVAPGAREIEFIGKIPGDDRGCRIEPQLSRLTGRRDGALSIGAVVPLL